MSDNNTHFTEGVPRFHLIFSTGLGTGFSPWAPGTAGALLALAVWYGLYFILAPTALFWATVALIVVITVAGAWTSDIMERYWGPDPRTVNIDEFVGTWIPLLVCRFDSVPLTLLFGFLGFGFFRLIDIFKPLGCRWVDTHIKGGWGVMLDDVLAGTYALLLIVLIRFIFCI